MPVEALKALKPAEPRRFVPAKAELGDWAQVEPLFVKLETAAAGIKSAKALERWVLDASELGAALDQEGSSRYINMTCQTDDAEAEKAFLHFVENIDPKAKPHWHKIKEAFIGNPCHKKLPRRRWMVFTRGVRNDVRRLCAVVVPQHAQGGTGSRRPRPPAPACRTAVA